MKQRHIDCQDARCRVCLDDAFRLEKRLEDEMGTGNRIDVLGRYRRWMDDKDIPAETEWGWSTSEVYQEENIKAFVRDWLGKNNK